MHESKRGITTSNRKITILSMICIRVLQVPRTTAISLISHEMDSKMLVQSSGGKASCVMILFAYFVLRSQFRTRNGFLFSIKRKNFIDYSTSLYITWWMFHAVEHKQNNSHS